MKWFITIPEFIDHGDFVVLDEYMMGWTRGIGKVLLFPSRSAAAEYAAHYFSRYKIHKDTGYKFFFGVRLIS